MSGIAKSEERCGSCQHYNKPPYHVFCRLCIQDAIEKDEEKTANEDELERTLNECRTEILKVLEKYKASLVFDTVECSKYGENFVLTIGQQSIHIKAKELA